MNSRRQFDYKPPSFEEQRDRADKKGSGLFNPMFKNPAKVFIPVKGDNLVRIMPPGWKDARHYGYEIRVHRNIGPDNRGFLCLKENPTSPYKNCPICEERHELSRRRAADDDIKALRPQSVVLFYIVDRDHEKEGVQIWRASNQTDSEIAAQSINRRSGKVINIVDIEEGYDVEFVRTGEGLLSTRYKGFQVARSSSPLSDSQNGDDWADFVLDNPLPSMLVFYSPEHIKEVYYGRADSSDVAEVETIRTSALDDDGGEPVDDADLSRGRTTTRFSRGAAASIDDLDRRTGNGKDKEGRQTRSVEERRVPRRQRVEEEQEDEDDRPVRRSRNVEGYQPVSNAQQESPPSGGSSARRREEPEEDRRPSRREEPEEDEKPAQREPEQRRRRAPEPEEDENGEQEQPRRRERVVVTENKDVQEQARERIRARFAERARE